MTTENDWLQWSQAWNSGDTTPPALLTREPEFGQVDPGAARVERHVVRDQPRRFAFEPALQARAQPLARTAEDQAMPFQARGARRAFLPLDGQLQAAIQDCPARLWRPSLRHTFELLGVTEVLLG